MSHFEIGAVERYLQYGVRCVKASAFLDLTASIVRYRADLHQAYRGIEITNQVIAKSPEQRWLEDFWNLHQKIFETMLGKRVDHTGTSKFGNSCAHGRRSDCGSRLRRSYG